MNDRTSSKLPWSIFWERSATEVRPVAAAREHSPETDTLTAREHSPDTLTARGYPRVQSPDTLKNMSKVELQQEAERVRLKVDGRSWKICCPPNSSKQDIFNALCQHDNSPTSHSDSIWREGFTSPTAFKPLGDIGSAVL